MSWSATFSIVLCVGLGFCFSRAVGGEGIGWWIGLAVFLAGLVITGRLRPQPRERPRR